MALITFIAGFVLGGNFGVLMWSLVAAGAREDERQGKKR